MTVVELSGPQAVIRSTPSRLPALRSDWRLTEWLVCDGLALVAAFATATIFHFDDADLASLLPRALGLHWLCLFVAEAYTERNFLFGERRREICAGAKGALAAALLLVLSAPPRLEASWLLVHAAAYPLAVTCLTVAGRALLGAQWRRRRAPRTVLIAGDALLAEELRMDLARRHPGTEAARLGAASGSERERSTLERTASRIIHSAAASGTREVVYCDWDLDVSDAAFLAERLVAAGLTVRIVSRRIGRLARPSAARGRALARHACRGVPRAGASAGSGVRQASARLGAGRRGACRVRSDVGAPCAGGANAARERASSPAAAGEPRRAPLRLLQDSDHVRPAAGHAG